MADAIIQVTGIQETARMLESAPKNVVAGAFLKALDAAGRVIEGELWPRTPVDLKAAVNNAHGGKGVLVGRLDAFIELDSKFRGGSVEVGFGDLGHIANWVEYGHKQVTGGRLDKGGSEVGQVEPHPFMRRAYDASADAAIDAFASVLEAEITAALLNP